MKNKREELDSSESSDAKQKVVYCCLLCTMSFASELKLKTHVRNIHQSTKFKCKLCHRKMGQRSLKRHLREVHDMSFSSGKTTGNNHPMYFAAICYDDVESDEQSPDQEDPCEMLCKVEMKDGTAEGDKIVNLSFKGIECKICHQMYSKKPSLVKHMYNVHNMSKIKCQVCEKEVTKKSFGRHMRSVHSAKIEKKKKPPVPDEEKIPCMFCEIKCINLMSLQNHIRNIHEAEKFKCPQCNYRGIKQHLKNHIKREHSGEVFQCSRCQKTLKSKITLKEHMLIHTDDRRFVCDICGMRFKRTSNYHGHLKSHQEKKFQCQLCGNFFLRRRYLAVHQQTVHNYYGEGVPPQEVGYKCEVCGVKLKWKNNLLAHMRIHTGEKPYKCKLCGKDFTCHGSLRTHMAKHGDLEDLENVKKKLSPLEAAALSCILEMASMELFIIDVGACSNDPQRSNVIARRKVIEVIESTRKEIKEKKTFEILYKKTKEEAEMKKTAKLLAKTTIENQLRIEELKSKLKGQELAKVRDMNEKQEIIAALKDSIHEEITKSEVKLRYIDLWEAARQGQNRMRCQNAENEWERKLEEVTNKFNNEIRVHEEISTFLSLEEKVLLEELKKWKESYEKEMKRRTEKIKLLEVKKKEQQILYHNLLEVFEERQKEIDSYLDLKEKLRLEEERNIHMNEMATKIQAWWRGTMVRRGLGPFKKKKKLGKEKKK